ncbi:ATP-binding protein [Terrimonas sp. NA20]|uniref:histidine kinase n=1 Tax=Terrimonas ginsenosidimutans TaxID=2908004 RepID=A0ABS9L0B6_9BACT|nr:ATP-binding protein [Terrimonas ginsenosidimutans]MCG2618067.1 ATP-binding protein [Terrimonas ginsenosidimutans]
MTSKRIIYYLLAAFITGNLLLIFMQYNSARNIDTLIYGNEKLLEEFKTDNELRELEKNMFAMESDIRGAIAMSDESVARNITEQVDAVQRDLLLLQQITDDDSSIKFIDDLDRLVQEKILLSRQILDTFVHSGKKSAEILMADQQGRKLMDSISLVSHKIDTSRQALFTVVTKSIDDSGRKARRWGTILIIIVLLSGAGLFWYIINRIASQNQLIRQLDASERKEREAARIKENFLANMSHEIRTPMNAILGFASLLEKKTLDRESADYIHTIRQSGENLLTIINDILDLSRIEAGMMRIESIPFGVRELMQSVETMFREKAKEKGLLLSTVIDDKVPEELQGDAVRLTQIMVNLIGNAIKFTRQGSVSIQVSASGMKEDEVLLAVSVSDTGIGIDKEKLPGIFNRFEQAEDSITRKYGGTGLGLSIVKDLVDMQHGNITVISEPGLGTRFQFSIPYKIVSSASGVNSVKEESRFAEPAKELKVLVVEDNEINQSLMKKLLGSWAIDPDIVSNGLEAIERLQISKYDIILMDIQMPEMDGYTAARIIREELRISTPVIAMTAHALAGEREKCLAAGMDEYIAKPVRERELQQMIVRFSSSVLDQDQEKNISANHKYKYIDLSYMEEISGGDIDYERTVTAQFLEIIPADLVKMNNALNKKDFTALSKLAHSIKASIAVMGMNAAMDIELDTMETGSSEMEKYVAFTRFAEYCKEAMKEVHHFNAIINK